MLFMNAMIIFIAQLVKGSDDLSLYRVDRNAYRKCFMTVVILTGGPAVYQLHH